MKERERKRLGERVMRNKGILNRRNISLVTVNVKITS